MEFCNVYISQKAGTHSNFFFSHDQVTYEIFFFLILKLHAIYDRRLHLDALLSISVYSGLKCCLSLLDINVIRLLSRNFRNSSMFSVTCKNPPSCQRAFRLLIQCAKMSSSSGNKLLPKNRFYATSNFWRSLINWSIFSGYAVFVPVINLYCCFVSVVVCVAFGLLVLSSVFRFCVFMLFLCSLYNWHFCYWARTLINAYRT